MSSTSMLRSLAPARRGLQQTRAFSRSTRRNKIYGTSPLRAKVADGNIFADKYQVVDHEYDALVIGAGGAGLR